MEPFNISGDDQRGSKSPGLHALIPGLILVGVGALFLLDNLHLIHVAEWFAYWPVILIAIGAVQLVDAVHAPRRIIGGILMALGGLFLADNLGYLAIRIEDLWPLILIAVGLVMLWTRTTGRSFPWWQWPQRQRRWRAMPFGDTSTSFSGNMVNEYAVFGGTRRVVTDPDFKGGRLACMFGGIHLDLTGAGMMGNSAVLEMSAIYGGATVRIPMNWNLEVRGAGIFGGFVDRTIHPPVTPDMKHLIVRGAAIFGGVTFKN